MMHMGLPLHPEVLTWTALLGKWIEFAKASVALPRDGEGGQWRASVASVINLQAVTFALAEIGELPAEDRPVALDRAEVLVNDNRAALTAAWGEGMPASLREAIDDARAALDMAREAEFAGRS
jgi:hypothetical protein